MTCATNDDEDVVGDERVQSKKHVVLLIQVLKETSYSRSLILNDDAENDGDEKNGFLHLLHYSRDPLEAIYSTWIRPE